jgi:hypothetical protein
MFGKTIKLAFVFFIGVLAGCCTHSTTKIDHSWQAQNDTDLVNSTVALVKYKDSLDNDVEPEDKSGILQVYCSGVWVSHNIIITAAHCIEDIGRPSKTIEEQIIDQILGLELPVWDPTGQKIHYSTRSDVWDEPDKDFRGSHESVIIAFYPAYDLALIKAKPPISDLQIPSHAVASLASDITIGSDVKIVGHPGGMWWSFTKGTVSAIHTKVKSPKDEAVNAIQISAPIWFGNSGGGAFNERGELLGICSWIKNVPNISFFIHTRLIRQILRENQIVF